MTGRPPSSMQLLRAAEPLPGSCCHHNRPDRHRAMMPRPRPIGHARSRLATALDHSGFDAGRPLDPGEHDAAGTGRHDRRHDERHPAGVDEVDTTVHHHHRAVLEESHALAGVAAGAVEGNLDGLAGDTPAARDRPPPASE